MSLESRLIDTLVASLEDDGKSIGEENYKRIYIVIYDYDAGNEKCIHAYIKWEIKLLENKQYVITKGFDECVLIFANNEFERFSQALRALPEKEPYNRLLCRFFLASSDDVELDKKGRLGLFSKAYANHGNWQNEVVIIGKGNVAQIWDKTTLIGNPDLIDYVWKKYEEIVN
ncbi:division/cell wall cluster transcriptional repressor MraZ [Butyrivibrio sp. AC2005]|uniref:division/cell wall cluster transcriptional repressor MraZ n=2 Tax=Butyrivibrio sp. AC2005 TaxID=1280672 RepID=UPI00040F6A55|nr:division/cell wall cluster transcriptional repressor MraZ [Butyrivibrio sp. AC2005]